MIHRFLHCIITSSLLFLACSNKQNDVQNIVDQAIKYSNLIALENAEASFVFRDKNYNYSMSNGKFVYTRTQIDSLGQTIVDSLSNQGITRMINNDPIELTEKQQKSYSSSINSVIYFAFLPFRLNDEAVIKEYVGLKEIRGASYHKIKVSFKQAGGGTDHEDIFYYWFDAIDFSLDYLAYSYATDEGGIRFREAFNSRLVNGMLVQDYKNYKPINEDAELATIDDAFMNDELILLSEIVLENMQFKISN